MCTIRLLTVWTQWRRHRQCEIQTVLQQEFSNKPSYTNERCPQISRKNGQITRHAFGDSPWKQMLPLPVQMSMVWTSSLNQRLSCNSSVATARKAIDLAEYAYATGMACRPLMPVDAKNVPIYTALFALRTLAMRMKCEWLTSAGYQTRYWPYSYLWIRLFPAYFLLILQKWLVRHHSPCAYLVFINKQVMFESILHLVFNIL